MPLITSLEVSKRSIFTLAASMLFPLKLQGPAGTMSVYITAISLCKTAPRVAVNLFESGAIFGATFVGPNDQYILEDNVFNLPVIAINQSVPVELMVNFNFNDDMAPALCPNQQSPRRARRKCDPGPDLRVRFLGSEAGVSNNRHYLFQKPQHADPHQNESRA